jgi:hypothetical protein
MATIVERTQRYLDSFADHSPHLKESEVIAIKSAIISAIMGMRVEIEPLDIQFPDFVDNMIAAPIEALSIESNRNLIEAHRLIGDTELWMMKELPPPCFA